MDTRRNPESTRNKQLVSNLRGRWPKECKRYTNAELVSMYDSFAISEDYGDNDAKFPEWLKDPPQETSAAA